MKKFVYTFLFILLSGACWTYSLAQTVVKVPSDNPPQEGNLNTAVQAAITAGKLSQTTFELEPYGYYVLTGTINVPAGQKLTVTAPEPGTTQAKAPPQIVWTSSGSVNTQFIFQCYGDISLKNVWIRYATTSGDQVGSVISIEDDPLAVKGRYGTFEGVIFDYSPCPQNSAGAVSIACTNFKGTFKNCYFKNCIDKHFRYYGRALSFPYNTTGWHSDSVSFENTTFANIGYVYMQEGGEYSDYVKFNHCTFLNVVQFALQSGWWNKLSVTNSIFVNTFMFGNIPAQTGTGDPNGAVLRIDSISTFGFSVPFTEQQRRILFANSSHVMEKWLSNWMYDNPYSAEKQRNRLSDEVPIPQPMLSPRTLRFFDSTSATGQKAFPYMNRSKLYEATDPGFIKPPTDTTLIKIFMQKKWSDNTDTSWAWKAVNDYNALWPMEENLAYTNTTLKTAGMGGFPLGDLYRWWPAQYTQWKAQETAENNRIATWLSTGKDPLASSVEQLIGGAVPSEYRLSQNYPNPFNPTTRIEYSVPLTGQVSLKVFNTLGQEVATLFDGVQTAGKYVSTFDGKGLVSGVYFYRLTSGCASITQKLVLMK
ncbi:MAG: T9SS type A sorting domain-containing protein [Ignavibacteria bacterium]|nr:T9SS type A sorting domain-containing protein [Ignavibacteria bacterium]